MLYIYGTNIDPVPFRRSDCDEFIPSNAGGAIAIADAWWRPTTFSIAGTTISRGPSLPRFTSRPAGMARAGYGARDSRFDGRRPRTTRATRPIAIVARGMSDAPFAGSRSESRELERANRLGRCEADCRWTSTISVFRASRTLVFTSASRTLVFTSAIESADRARLRWQETDEYLRHSWVIPQVTEPLSG